MVLASVFSVAWRCTLAFATAAAADPDPSLAAARFLFRGTGCCFFFFRPFSGAPPFPSPAPLPAFAVPLAAALPDPAAASVVFEGPKREREWERAAQRTARQMVGGETAEVRRRLTALMEAKRRRLL